MTHMEEKHLRGLKRSELQRLAREHKIKANLKSSVIIDLLLRAASGSKPHAKTVPAPAPHPADEVPSSVNINTRQPQNDLGAMSDPDSIGPVRMNRRLPIFHQYDRGSEMPEVIWEDTPRSFYRVDIAQMARDIGLSYPDSPCDIKNFDREQLPAPESLVKESVAMLAELDKEDQKLMDKVAKMHETISQLRSQIKDTRALLRAENARRRRAEQYFLYSQPVAKCWSYEEVWSGPVKIQHDEDMVGVTTSDEEEEEEETDIEDNDPDMEWRRDLDSRRWNEQTKYHEDIARHKSNGKPEDTLLSPVDGSLTAAERYNTTAGQKRPREEDAHTQSDDARFAPRRRIERHCPDTPEIRRIVREAAGWPGLYCFSPPHSPTPKFVDKGKGKMTADQVAELEYERENERLLIETATEGYRSPEVHGHGRTFRNWQGTCGGANSTDLRSSLNPPTGTEITTRPAEVQDGTLNMSPAPRALEIGRIPQVETQTQPRLPMFTLNPNNPLAMEGARGDRQNRVE